MFQTGFYTFTNLQNIYQDNSILRIRIVTICKIFSVLGRCLTTFSSGGKEHFCSLSVIQGGLRTTPIRPYPRVEIVPCIRSCYSLLGTAATFDTALLNFIREMSITALAEKLIWSFPSMEDYLL